MSKDAQLTEDALKAVDAWERKHANAELREAIYLYQKCLELEAQGRSVSDYFMQKMCVLGLSQMMPFAIGGEPE